MDTATILPREIEKSIEKFDKRTLRQIRDAGHGATVAGMALTKRYIGPLVKVIEETMADKRTTRGGQRTKDFVRIIGGLSPEVIALCTLQNCLDAVGRGKNIRDTALILGRAIAGECWAHKITTARDTKKRAAALKAMDYAKRVASGTKQRRQAMRSHFKRSGFQVKMWDRKHQLIAGEWLLNVALRALPELFARVEIDEQQSQLTITDGAMEIADAAIRSAVLNNPVYAPLTDVPRPWIGWSMEASTDPRVNYSINVVRSPYKDTAVAVKHAIKTGQMQPALNALNALQSVPFKINHRILDIMQYSIEKDLDIPGLPPRKDVPLPEPFTDKQWDAMTDQQKRLSKLKIAETKKLNLSFIGERVLLKEDMEIAQLMVQQERFYTPMNCDWRGRVYGISHFNYQREDRVRALFMFADGAPIGEEGFYWLKVHVANCGDFGKISKRPFDERVKWVDDNLRNIVELTDYPHSPWLPLDWKQADKPFLFLAACYELVDAITEGPSFVTHLPIAFDGSCSGLQHLCAMTRAEEGRLVNLTPSPEPQDVYETVAVKVRENVAADKEEPELAKLFLDYGITRKVCKRNVMTYSYSSKAFGMAGQQQEDLMEPLAREVLEGKRDSHPFSPYQSSFEGRPSKAARYIAGHVFHSIEEIIKKPAQAMKFLQSLAKTMAHEGKPLTWVTPVGLPWINRYHEPETTRVKLWLQDHGVKIRHDVKLAIGHKPEVDKDKAANGVAPNFVHACDAAHLMMVVNASVNEGITNVATVHDSFACLATHAGRFTKLIREQFVQMYQDHDVLSEVLASARRDLTDASWGKLPPVVQQGPLDITETLNAQFSFA